jgi:superfamily II DNA or RNA helicase
MILVEENRFLILSLGGFSDYTNFSKMNIIKDILDSKFSYYQNGYQFTPSFKAGTWDGKIRLYKIKKLKDKDFVFLIPVGFKYDLINELNQRGIKFSFQDNTIKIFNKIDKELIWSGFKLRDYQEESVKKALNRRIGIISLPTGSGKMAVISYLIYSLKQKAVVFVRNIESVKQTKEEIEQCIKGIKVGIWITGEKDIKNCDVVLTTFNSLNNAIKNYVSKKVANDLYLYCKSCSLYIVDECHHVSNNMYRDVLEYMNPYYCYGLTGTAYRNDNSDLALKSVFGDIVYYKNVKDLQDKGILSESKIYFFKIKEFKLDEINLKKDFPELSEIEFSNIKRVHTNHLYKLGIVYNEKRTEIIRKLINYFQGKKILILVKFIYHGEYLSRILGVPFVHGSSPKKLREEFLDKFRRSKDFNILISSTIYDESVNIPELEIVINCTGHSSSISQIQRHGRVVRKSQGKDICLFFDFYDEIDYRTEKHSKKRIKSMNKEGLIPIIVSDFKDILYINKLEKI